MQGEDDVMETEAAPKKKSAKRSKKDGIEILTEQIRVLRQQLENAGKVPSGAEGSLDSSEYLSYLARLRTRRDRVTLAGNSEPSRGLEKRRNPIPEDEEP